MEIMGENERRCVLISEAVLGKTKVLRLSSSLTIVNECSFDIEMSVKHCAETLHIASKSKLCASIALREEDRICLRLLSNGESSEITLRLKEYRRTYANILSFNFVRL
jgi:hypothetical protein